MGTTLTALVAALLASRAAIELAMVHLLFNLFGALLFLPFRPVRETAGPTCRRVRKAHLTPSYLRISLRIFLLFFVIPFLLIYLLPAGLFISGSEYFFQNIVFLPPARYLAGLPDFFTQTMTRNEVTQQRWNDTVEKLRLRFNLSDQEVVTIKEWGIALLITGVSVWVLYRIVRTILGFSSKKTVKVKVEAPKKKRRAEKERKPAIRRAGYRLSARRAARTARSPSRVFLFALVSLHPTLRRTAVGSVG